MGTSAFADFPRMWLQTGYVFRALRDKRERVEAEYHHDDAPIAVPVTNARRSALIWSGLVVAMP